MIRARLCLPCFVLLGCSTHDAPSAGGTLPDAPQVSPTADAPPSSSGASLSGSVRRSAQPSDDAKGSLYIAVFDQDPIAHKDTAKVVGNTLIANADLSAMSASIAYSIASVTPRMDD